MIKRTLSSLAMVTIGVLLAWGMARASMNLFQKEKKRGQPQSRFEEQRHAFLEQCAAERTRLGLTDRAAVFAKHPSPEITLCRAVRVVPGGTGEVVTRGKFPPGTKFLFENDQVELQKETLTGAEYRARVSVAAGGGPSFARLHAFAPVSAGTAQCMALYVGGKYEWEFTAQNGWRIRLTPTDEGFRADAGQPPEPKYRADFYHGAEPKPFETRELKLSLGAAPWDNSYTGYLVEEQPSQGGAMAEIQKLGQRLADPKLSEAERDRLMQQLNQLSEKMVQEQQGAMQKMMSPGYQQEVERKRQEFGCHALSIRLRAGGVEGSVACGEKVGTLQLKGTLKLVGP